MTTKPESALDEALARHKAAQAAYAAAEAAHDEEASDYLSAAESDVCDELTAALCTGDDEFMKKLRYLLARETHLWGWPSRRAEFRFIVYAVATHLGVSYDDDGKGAV
jgi:hypothetical protein